MKWVYLKNKEDVPADDSHADYPKEYILKCTCDGWRGNFEVHKVTTSEMWETACQYDQAKYLLEP